jgi:hypothetical protein
LAQEPKAILVTTAEAPGAAPAEGETTARKVSRRRAGEVAIAVGVSWTGRKARRRNGGGGDIPISMASNPDPGWCRWEGDGRPDVWCSGAKRVADQRKNKHRFFQLFI